MERLIRKENNHTIKEITGRIAQAYKIWVIQEVFCIILTKKSIIYFILGSNRQENFI